MAVQFREYENSRFSEVFEILVLEGLDCSVNKRRVGEAVMRGKPMMGLFSGSEGEGREDVMNRQAPDIVLSFRGHVVAKEFQ